MKLIYVCSPYRGESPHSPNKRNRNLNKAAGYCREVLNEGGIPIAPHLYFTRFLSDVKEEDRAKGLAMGRELVEKCDELWVFGKLISEGMKAEIELAERLGKPIVYRQ